MYDKENVFAKIIKGQIPAKTVYKDDKVMAFYDIHPKAKTHVLVIPTGEYKDYTDFVTTAPASDVAHFFTKVADIANDLGVESGYKVLANTGVSAGQEVFHFHMHIISNKE